MTTSLVDDRDTALKVGFAATDWSAPVDYDSYRAGLTDWDVKAIMRDNECIGAFYRKGDEVHVSIVKEHRRKWATKGLLRTVFGTPRVTTKVSPGHDYMYGILARLGFSKQPDGLLIMENQHGN